MHNECVSRSSDVSHAGVPEWPSATSQRRPSLSTDETAQDTHHHLLSRCESCDLSNPSGMGVWEQGTRVWEQETENGGSGNRGLGYGNRVSEYGSRRLGMGIWEQETGNGSLGTEVV